MREGRNHLRLVRPDGWSGHPSPGPRDCHAVKASIFFSFLHSLHAWVLAATQHVSIAIFLSIVRQLLQACQRCEP